jgi:hypothetical protein
MGRALARAGRIASGLAAGAALVELGWLARTWYRYGTPPVRANRLLDPFLPRPEIAERHRIRVAAPAELTWAAARELDLARSRLVRALFRGRELMMHGTPARQQPAGPFLQQVRDLGWIVLAEEPGRGMVLGAVTRPWESDVRFEGIPPERFSGFSDPRYVKIAWTLQVDPLGAEESEFLTETRAAATDGDARARFRRYWAVVSPGVVLIRRAMIRQVKAEAERRFAAVRPPRVSSGRGWPG